ncbi:MAG: tetratricopeptide repeat protein, partial [Lentisphaeria bacterium]
MLPRRPNPQAVPRCRRWTRAAALGLAALLAGAAAPAADDPFAAFMERDKGLRAETDGLYDAAASFFRDYRDASHFQEPAFSDATVLLVRAALRRARTAEAVEALNYHAEHANPAAITGYYVDALAYWTAATRLTAGDWTAAENALRPLVAPDRTPEFRELALEAVGILGLRQGKWAEAEAAYRTILRDFPAAVHFRARLGLIQVALASGDTAQARRALDALERDTDATPGTETRLGLARVRLLLAEDQVAAAKSVYQALTAKNPPSPGQDACFTTLQLAEALAARDHRDEAAGLFENAIGLADCDTDRIRARLRHAETLIALRRVDAAIAALEAFRREFPDARIHTVDLQLADLLHTVNNPLTASEYYQLVADNNAAPPEFRFRAAFSRGVCLNEAAQPANASTAFSRAAKLAMTPAQQAESLFLAADAAFRQGNYNSAALLFQNVADGFPGGKWGEDARFRQGLSRLREGQYASSALIFRQFLDAFPASKLADQAVLERAIALREAGDPAGAGAELDALVKARPASPLAPQALLESYQAAFAAGNATAAVGALTRLLRQYPESPLAPRALYLRAHLQFLLLNNTDAMADAEKFLADYPALPLAADVHLWLADASLNDGDAARAEQHFLDVAADFPTSPLAPRALLEVARLRFGQQDYTGALACLEQLGGTDPVPPPAVRAQAAILNGDILAAQGKLAAAASTFAEAVQTAPATVEAATAAGRQAEVLLAIGATDPARLEEARVLLAALLRDPLLPPELRDATRYRLAKTLERQKKPDAALKEYLDIVYGYDLDLQAGRVRD